MTRQPTNSTTAAIIVISGGVALGLALIAAYETGLADGRREAAPVALAPAHDTTLIVRAVLVPPPRPDTALRYICRAAP